MSRATDVCLQWDPDHGPLDEKLERKAIRLGVRNGFLSLSAGEGIVHIEDISAFVAKQRYRVLEPWLDKLIVPCEERLDVLAGPATSLHMR